MGRHGGGSSSGGGGGSHSSRSRNSGARVRTSSTPFRGCYNRSYYDRYGHYHQFYTSDQNYGTKSGFNLGTIITLVFVTIHMCLMMSGFLPAFIHFGSKVDGDISRIKVIDKIDIMTPDEEQKTLELLHDIYDESGMPVTVCTDNFAWKQYYNNLEVYSEELYYAMGMDEDAMIILFTAENTNDHFIWEYDMYCGDSTIRCFSDTAFDTLLSNFQKAMAGQNLYNALNYSWNSVIDDLGKTSININQNTVWGLAFLVFLYGMFYISIIGGALKQNQVYKYFKDNPEKLSRTPMRLYSTCPSCNASNSGQSETCAYCGTLLKISDGNVEFVDPD